MTDMRCTYDKRRDEVLVAYLYDELSPDERTAFDSHLLGCEPCRLELMEFQAVRTELAGWAPPEPARVLAFTPPGRTAPPRSRFLSALAAVPAWAQVAAALLVLGVAAGIANVEVRYDREGVSVRTGWCAFAGAYAPASAGQVPARGAGAPASAGRVQAPGAEALASARAAAASDGAPWRGELAALERDLRAQVEKVSIAAAPGGARADDDTMRRVRALIEASERNQRRELALRVAEMAREIQAQRVADLQRIQRNLAVIENTTGGAIVRQGKLLNNLAVRVSQQQ